MNYKSQHGQDKWVAQNLFGGMTHGYFVDIGAADGETISNTWVFEKELQWDGICIDSCDSTWETLVKNRSCRCDNMVISDQDGEVDFYEVTSKGFADSFFSGTNPPASHPEYVVKRKKCQTLFNALTRLNSATLIHYLSIDTEGTELDILRRFFTDEYETSPPGWKRRILAISIEHNFNREYREQIRTFLTENFYTHAVSLGVDDVYVHRIYDVMYT